MSAMNFQEDKLNKTFQQDNKNPETREKRKRYSFDSINKFIRILKRIKISKKVLEQPSEEDYNWGKFQYLMEDFMEIVASQI